MKNEFIIWSPQGEKPPTQTYTLRWKAQREADRLSLEHPNQVFNVCKIKSTTVGGETAYFGKWRPANMRGRICKPKYGDVVDTFGLGAELQFEAIP